MKIFSSSINISMKVLPFSHFYGEEFFKRIPISSLVRGRWNLSQTLVSCWNDITVIAVNFSICLVRTFLKTKYARNTREHNGINVAIFLDIAPCSPHVN
jgi:hypothetical protein